MNKQNLRSDLLQKWLHKSLSRSEKERKKEHERNSLQRSSESNFQLR